MKYTFKNGKKSTIEAKITIDATEWAEAITQAYNKNKGRFNIPGFRKGHAPKHVIEQAYGKGVFYEEAVNIALPKYYEEFLAKEKDIKDIDRPEVDIDKLDDNGVTFKLVIPVRPEVKLGAYTGINIEKVVYNVTEEDVEKELERLKERNSREISVTDRAAKDGDITVIDYCGKIDGVEFKGGKAEKQTLVLGSKTFIPGFEEQVEGMNIGDEKDITVKFPDDYPSEEVKGKEAVFTVKLHEIKVKELPEVNDEFIKDATGDENLEAWKVKTIEKFQKANDAKAKNETEDKLIVAISDATEVEIPRAMIDRQIDAFIQETEYRMMYQGIKLEDYLKYLGQTMEEFRKGYEEPALKRVKQQLVVEEIIAKEGFTATQEEIDAKVAEQAKSVNKEVEEYKKSMDPRQFEYIEHSIIVEKLFDFLKANNNIA